MAVRIDEPLRREGRRALRRGGAPVTGRRAPSEGRKAIGGGAWTFAERVVAQLAQLAVFIVAARILGPAEFGVFALVSAVAFVLLRVAEFGWAPFIMNWSGDERVPRQILTLSLVSGALVGLVGALLAGLLHLAGIGGEIAALAALFSIWLAAGPFAAAMHGLLVRRGRLAAASACEIAGELAALAVGVAALVGGHGILALAYGRLAYVGVVCILTLVAARTLPARRLKGAPFRAIRSFSFSVLANGLIFQLRGQVGTFLVGAFLGPAAVGHYRAAERLTGAVAEIIGVPSEKIAWSYLRRARDAASGGIGSALWREHGRRYFAAVKLVSIPLLLWVALVSGDIVEGLLGPGWGPAAMATSLLAVARMLTLYGHATEPVLALAGEVRRLPGVMLALLGVAVALTLVSAPFGLLAVGAAQIVLGAVVLTVTLRLFSRHAAFAPEVTLAGTRTTLLASAAAGIAAIAMTRAGIGAELHPLVRAILVGMAVLPLYVALAVVLERLSRGGGPIPDRIPAHEGSDRSG